MSATGRPEREFSSGARSVKDNPMTATGCPEREHRSA